MALLAVLTQQPGEPALVPLGDDLACGDRQARIHAHVQRRVVRVGEAALARVELHRGHSEVEGRDVGLEALSEEQIERLRVAGADEAQRAWQRGREVEQPPLGERVAVYRDERARSAKARGEQAR